jgi:hypothetical protein
VDRSQVATSHRQYTGNKVYAKRRHRRKMTTFPNICKNYFPEPSQQREDTERLFFCCRANKILAQGGLCRGRSPEVEFIDKRSSTTEPCLVM